MGIQVEFNPDLALRNFSEYTLGKREREECIPDTLIAGQEHPFLKKGQRLYWLSDNPQDDFGELPLIETDGEKHTPPLASVKILEATHFLKNGESWTRGIYRVVEVFHGDSVFFNGLSRVR